MKLVGHAHVCECKQPVAVVVNFDENTNGAVLNIDEFIIRGKTKFGCTRIVAASIK